MKTIKKLLLLGLLVTPGLIAAQMCTQDNRFTNTEYFSNTQIDSLKNVTYGNAVNNDGSSQDLKIDFYFPKSSEDTMAKRPFILLIHGGGFQRGSKGGYTTHLSKEFAKRGFVTATMSYRLGFDQASPGDGVVAVYRAQQDANAALRYTVENADDLKIDTSWIFVGGSSAGAITSLVTAYGSQEEWSQFFPTIETTFGSLDSSGNTLKQTFTIKAIFNNYGAVSPVVLGPDEELLPMISFHGELDKVVPIDKSAITGFGSRTLHNMLNEQGVCNDFTIVPTAGHVVYRSKEEIEFVVGRTACFFKSLMCGTCTSFVASETVPANCAN